MVKPAFGREVPETATLKEMNAVLWLLKWFYEASPLPFTEAQGNARQEWAILICCAWRNGARMSVEADCMPHSINHPSIPPKKG